MIKEHLFNESSFIGGWYIDENICDNIINFFNSNPDKQYPAQVGEGQLNNTAKKGTEIFCPVEVIDFHLKDYLKNLHQCYEYYINKFNFAKTVTKIKVENIIKIQNYKPTEGYYGWHFENNGYGENIKRHLVFMTYLNDVEDGGTEFKYQNLITPAKKGLTLIWPSIWTHTHKGQISNTRDKYIITGWFSYVD